MTAPAPLLDVTDLTVTYRRDDHVDTALHGVSFGIERGRTTAIIGESGSGKSTLAHSVVRLLPRNGEVTGGRIVFDEENLLDRTDRELRPVRGRHIGFVPQDPIASLNPTKTVGAQLREAFTLAHSPLSRPEVDERIVADLADVGFREPRELLRRYPHELSGGMRQRVLVTLAFSQRPALVIADEPTSALDVLVGRDVLESLQESGRRHGTTVVLITHDLVLARRHADDVIVLEQGRIVEHGPVAEVFAEPRHAYTRSLLASSVRLSHGRVLSIAEAYRRHEGGSPVASSGPDTGRTGDVRGYAVELEHVTKEFRSSRGHVQAVADLSLRVPTGSTFALVGESGSGKTTTSRIILGLESADAGTVRVLGRDVTAMGRRELRDLRRRVQVVYQSPFESLNPRLDLGRIIAEPLEAYRVGDRHERRRRVLDLLEHVRLPASYATRRPGELSGGQRQRVAIARALALEPEVVVLDEPVSALDATIQAQVLALLQELQQELDLTYFLVTHDLAVVADVAQGVGVMRHGRLVETGSARDVMLAPSAEYTRSLLAV